jgi:hypothetical protein
MRRLFLRSAEGMRERESWLSSGHVDPCKGRVERRPTRI